MPICKGLEVDDDDLIRADVIKQLMCYDRLNFSRFGSDHRIDFPTYFEAELARLEPLALDDLIDLTDDDIVVTPKGRLLLRSIAMIFDRHLNREENDGRFSKAI